MSPEVIRAKLALLQQVLLDLKPHVTATRESQENSHYEIERQVQVAVDLCVALGRRMLLLKGFASPDTSRETFILLAKHKIIPRALANPLANSVGLRNLIVHEYGALNYALFFSGLKAGYQSFVRFSAVAKKIAIPDS